MILYNVLRTVAFSNPSHWSLRAGVAVCQRVRRWWVRAAVRGGVRGRVWERVMRGRREARRTSMGIRGAFERLIDEWLIELVRSSMRNVRALKCCGECGKLVSCWVMNLTRFGVVGSSRRVRSSVELRRGEDPRAL